MRPGDLALSPKCQVWGNRAQVTIFLPCGNWALCSQMSVSVKARVFSSFPQDKVRADQSSVAATLAPCHCRPPGPGWLGWSRRPQKTGTFYSFFMDLTLVRLPRCSGPPLSVTQPRPRPHPRPQMSPDVNKLHRVTPVRQ